MSKKNLQVYSDWKTISVLVNNLVLDPHNVRLDLEPSARSKIDQNSIINDLFSNENAFQILENIVDNGWFVDELPVVTKESNKYVVLEGNRRVAALKALQNPLLSSLYSSKIKPLSEAVEPIERIRVLISPNRGAALKLLASKHTKSTTRPWKPLRQAYFYYAQLGKNKTVSDLKKDYKGVDVEDFVKMCEVHKVASSYDFGDVEINNKVRRQLSFPVSTLERLYLDSKFRDHLNFEFDRSGKIKIQASRRRFDEEFKKVIRDAVDKKIDTRKLNSDESRRRYIEERLSRLNKVGKKVDSSQYSPKPPIKKIKKTFVPLFDSSLSSTLNCRGIDRVFEELKTIDYRKYPNASHDVLRSFLEAVLKVYLQNKNHEVSPKRSGGFIFLSDVLNSAEQYFKQQGENQIRQIVTELKNQKESFDTINHNPSVFSTEEKVKNAADQMADLIKYIFEDE